MRKFSIALVALLGFSTAAQAHEIWLERDGKGPVRIYLGEPGEILPPGGDPEFEKLQAPRLVPAATAQQVRKAGYIEVAAPPGDARVIDDSVFAPWGEDGKKQGVIYYARAGRAETATRLPYEIAPTAPNADSFALLHDGKPMPGAKITVITPDKWTRSFTADASGKVTLPLREKGRYILTATHEEKGDLTLAGKPVSLIYHMASTSFVAGK